LTPPPPPWLEPAWSALGEREVPGDVDSALVREMHAAVDGRELPDAVPWCSSFVAWCFVQSGVIVPDGVTRAARSWLLAASMRNLKLSEPVLGAVAVLWRGHPHGAAGHVGLVVGASDTEVILLGGNQSDAVSIASFPVERLLGYRWPIGFALRPPLLP
jgi:uncharacterized protein (TIGR02594 family)